MMVANNKLKDLSPSPTFPLCPVEDLLSVVSYTMSAWEIMLVGVKRIFQRSVLFQYSVPSGNKFSHYSKEMS